MKSFENNFMNRFYIGFFKYVSSLLKKIKKIDN